MSIVPRRMAASARGLLVPIARTLVRAGVSANAVTTTGFLITAAGAALLASGVVLPALAVLLLGTVCDTLDGQVARAAGGGTTFGAFWDSTLDRLSDAALAVAAVWLGAATAHGLLFSSGLVLLVGSFLVSYVRAKAESLGAGASVGLAPREARIVLYLVGVAAWAVSQDILLFAAAVAVAAFLATVTVVQRIAHLSLVLDKKKG